MLCVLLLLRVLVILHWAPAVVVGVGFGVRGHQGQGPQFPLGPPSRDYSTVNGLDMYGPTVHQVSYSTVYVRSLCIYRSFVGAAAAAAICRRPSSLWWHALID